MKTSFLSLLLASAALTAIPAQTILAQDNSTSGPTSLSGGSTNNGGTDEQGRRFGPFRRLLAQLDLTEAQKAQIKQIFLTVTDPKERRQEIVAVLTPEQKARLRELIKQHRENDQSGADTPSAPSAG